jgi:hypothetical protein
LSARLGVPYGCHDTQHNETQHNETQHNGTQHNIEKTATFSMPKPWCSRHLICGLRRGSRHQELSREGLSAFEKILKKTWQKNCRSPIADHRSPRAERGGSPRAKRGGSPRAEIRRELAEEHHRGELK